MAAKSLRWIFGTSASSPEKERSRSCPDRWREKVRPKPDHLGPEYAAQFGDPSVVAAYRHRPPYPAEVFDILVGLIADEPRAVLDVGTGTGEIARGLAPR